MNSHERRVDARGLNYMQRVFDDLRAHPASSVDEIRVRVGLSREAVRGALERLRLDRAVRSACAGGVWRYGVREDALRPVDRRGGNRLRQMVQAAA